MRIALALCLALIAAAPALAKDPPPSDGGGQSADFLRMMGRAEGADLERRIQEASRHPLGTRENPVRVNSPAGQHAYLRRLRCSDGTPPSFNRVGNFGAGVFGSIIDGYDVRCARGEPRQSTIFMDMYFPEHDEQNAPPGFRIVP